jgi:hypothetical protein
VANTEPSKGRHGSRSENLADYNGVVTTGGEAKKRREKWCKGKKGA